MGLRKAYAKVSHHKVIFFRDTFLTRPFLQQSISVRHSSFVESEDEDVEEEDVEDEPEPSAFNVACCGRRFRACFSGLTGPFRPWGDVSGPWGNCSDKAGGPYAFLTHTLRVPYAKKHIFFSKFPPIKVHGKTCIYHISVYICTLIICCKLVCAIPVVSFLQQVFTARFPFHLTVINVTKHIDPHVSFIL